MIQWGDQPSPKVNSTDSVSTDPCLELTFGQRIWACIERFFHQHSLVQHSQGAIPTDAIHSMNPRSQALVTANLGSGSINMVHAISLPLSSSPLIPST